MDRVKRGKKRCYIESCKKTETEAASLHEFPSNAIVRKKWFDNIGLSKEQQENLPDKALVCNLHFSKDCFKSTISGRKQLKREAFPTLFLNRPASSSGNTPEISFLNISSIISASECVELNKNCIFNQIESLSCFKDLPPADPLACTSNVLSTSTQTSFKMESTMTDKSSQVDIINLNDIKKYKSEIQLLKRKIKRLNAKEKTLVDKLQEANEAISNSYFETLLKIKNDSNNNNTYAAFLLDQISNYGKQKPRFSELTVRNCIKWRRCSPSGYKYCQSTLLNLPSRTTINRYLGNNSDMSEANIEASCLKPVNNLLS